MNRITPPKGLTTYAAKLSQRAEDREFVERYVEHLKARIPGIADRQVQAIAIRTVQLIEAYIEYGLSIDASILVYGQIATAKGSVDEVLDTLRDLAI